MMRITCMVTQMVVFKWPLRKAKGTWELHGGLDLPFYKPAPRVALFSVKGNVLPAKDNEELVCLVLGSELLTKHISQGIQTHGFSLKQI